MNDLHDEILCLQLVTYEFDFRHVALRVQKQYWKEVKDVSIARKTARDRSPRNKHMYSLLSYNFFCNSEDNLLDYYTQYWIYLLIALS